MTQPLYYVLAPSWNAYRAWLALNQLTSKQAVMIRGVETLRGVVLTDDQVIRLDGSESIYNIDDLEDAIALRVNDTKHRNPQ